MPTPLVPACTSTVSPAFRRPNSNRQSCAVPHDTGTHAACSSEQPSGTRNVDVDGTETTAACDPSAISAVTRSPGLRSVTSAPTSRTTPAQL